MYTGMLHGAEVWEWEWEWETNMEMGVGVENGTGRAPGMVGA